MSPTISGLLVLGALLALLAVGKPVGFSLGAIAVGALLLTDGLHGIEGVAETIFAGLANFGMV